MVSAGMAGSGPARVLIRADASTQMGTGHVMRCLALAMALRQRGAAVTFLCRKHAGHLGDLLQAKGFSVLMLPLGSSVTVGLQHASWLGASLGEETEHVREALRGQPAFDWIVVDHYALDARAERNMRSHGAALLVIDDIADRDHDCDLLLDANLQLSGDRHASKVPPHCRFLLGPRFALLRPEFRQLRQAHTASERPTVPGRILVNLGGGDPNNVTGKVLAAIKGMALQHVTVDVVIGRGHPAAEEISSICAQMHRVHLHVQTDQMAQLMQQADLMIGAPGISTWERCCLGLPALLIAIADNQRDIGKGAGALRFAWYMGHEQDVSVQDIQTAVGRLLARPSLLRHMSTRGARLVDGLGAPRVAAALVKSLRITVVSDVGSWVNSYLVPMIQQWKTEGYDVLWVHNVGEVQQGDCTFFLSCGQLANANVLGRSTNNLVVHAGDLPRGRGWSPMTWQVLGGATSIPVCLFEAEVSVDSGPIYARATIELRGDELVDEMRAELGRVTVDLCQSFIADYPVGLQKSRPQKGAATYYPRRRPADSRLDATQSIAAQFNLLRVVDNVDYPAFFEHKGVRYVLRIEKDKAPK